MMTNQQHPIIPPSNLVEKWYDEIPGSSTDWRQQLATKAAQWGADEELKAVCQLLYADLSVPLTLSDIRAARRPKPPTLKELALTALHGVATGANDTREQHQDLDTIRQALEALDD